MKNKSQTGVSEAQPTSKKGRERRQNIVLAAKRRLIDKGLEGLVLREIASEMGITHGNLQYYFKTREDLLKAIFNDEIHVFTDPLSEATQQASSRNGRINAIIESSFQALEAEQTKLWRMLIGIADQNVAFANILKRENDFYESTLVEELKAISPKMSAARRAHVAKLVKCMVDGFAVELAYADSSTAQYRAFKGELRTFLQNLIQGD